MTGKITKHLPSGWPGISKKWSSFKAVNYSIIILGIFLLNACNGFLDEVDQDRLIPKTTDHYAALMLDELSNEYSSFARVDFMADNVVEESSALTSKKEGYKTLYTWQKEIELDEYGKTVSVNEAWKRAYEDIAIANYVIALIDDASGTDEERWFVKGEALFYRAMCYFNLVNLYAGSYNAETAATELGVPLRTDIGLEKTYNRNTISEVYDQVETDLAEARKLIEQSGLIKTKWHPSVSTCDLLMSRVKLYKKEWDETIEYSSQVIGKNSLSSLQVGSPFVYETNGEILFTLQNIGSLLLTVTTMQSSGYTVNPDLISLYDQNDKRLQIFFSRVQNPTGSYYYSKKVERDVYTDMGRVSYKVAEAYLNRAEAYAMKGELALASADMQTLLATRYTSFDGVTLPTTKDEMLSFILTERRKELCFEDHHRWFDLKRMENKPDLKHVFTLVDNSGVKQGTETYVLFANDPNYLLPIPLEERENNPLIRNNLRYEKLPVIDQEVILP